MGKKKLGLSEAELKESKKGMYLVFIIIFSITIALIVELMITDYLESLSIVQQFIVAILVIFPLVCLTIKSAKQK